MPICTENGAEVGRAIAHRQIAPRPDTLANPLTVSAPFEKRRGQRRAVQLRDRRARKPVPVTVALKRPSGSCPLLLTLVITGVGGISVTVAVRCRWVRSP